MFTPDDLQQFQKRGISLEEAQRQMKCFQTGFPDLNIIAAAESANGILCPSEQETDRYLQIWEQYLNEEHTILKFVPASGAASRMFKDLFEYMDGGQETEFIHNFLQHIDQFAFASDLKKLGNLTDGRSIVRHLLIDMNYGNLPKALLLFHHYPNEDRTPALEHLVEGAMYAKNIKNEVNIHFTVSHEHLPLFKQHIAANQAVYEDKYGVHYNISFSEQKPSTDTLAATTQNQPFRDKNGKLVFRPGGHGALIQNLNEQNADIVFIKNIDNVVPDRLKEPTIRYKKLIAGVLVSLQKQIFAYLKELENEQISEAKLQVIRQFIEQKLFQRLPLSADATLTDKETREYLRHRLNRPLRVCGMVRNEGEPGGGPFLVKENDGSISCQILESSQITDKSLMKTASYFNPVDLVCAIRDYKGQDFYLPDYVDPQTGFISNKSKNGMELKALELPGLWNGAMAHWNTIFVEVPITTFNPVKTVNDLLREQHQ